MDIKSVPLTRAQESRTAIEKLYIEMRHLFNRGSYKPFGRSGQPLIQSLLAISPEIYGSIADPKKVELDGLVYVVDRLPKGLESCRIIKITGEEGYGNSQFKPIIPPKRRRNCYHIDEDLMLIEVTRGKSEIYDILTHLSFLYNEAEKIKNNAMPGGKKTNREWNKLEAWVQAQQFQYFRPLNEKIKVSSKKSEKKSTDSGQDEKEFLLTYTSTLLGRTYEETLVAYRRLEESKPNNFGLFHLVYWLGRRAMEEQSSQEYREIWFTPSLRERIGHHIHGERWARAIKESLVKQGLWGRPLHVVSANLHSVMNSLYYRSALKGSALAKEDLYTAARVISQAKNEELREKIKAFALKNGMTEVNDHGGTHIYVQLFDCQKLQGLDLPKDLKLPGIKDPKKAPVIMVMDYAFGEQAFETIDELLKPYGVEAEEQFLSVASISIMGKAGILCGEKGDLMIPTAHVFEGTTDNYFLENDFQKEDFEQNDLPVFEGTMITVLGTSLQNKDILQYFFDSSWGAIGLEMEGAHYHKAIQAASKIRKSIDEKVVVRYAYYASDNPLVTGSTLASGSLGLTGIQPTYLITHRILKKIFERPFNE